MATCPRCHGHLTDTHRCPRRPVLIALEMAGFALAGAVAAVILVSLINANTRIPHLEAAAVAVGVFVGLGLSRLVRG